MKIPGHVISPQESIRNTNAAEVKYIPKPAQKQTKSDREPF